MKKIIAEKIASMMNDTAKKRALDMFYEKNKDKENIRELIKEMQDYLDYNYNPITKEYD